MQNFIGIARQEAKKSSYTFRLGAVVLRKGKIVGKGYNKVKTHPRLFKEYGYFSIHAECDALLKAASNGNGDTIIVVRIIKNGKYSCSKPCEKCLAFIKEYGIKKIIYSDWDGLIKEMMV
jgi:deoxycytidylate deaminase